MAGTHDGDGAPIIGWARRLGLAHSPLFDSPTDNFGHPHFALVDGRSASFACSAIPADRPLDSKGWLWSADLAHHVVLLGDDEVRIHSGRDGLRRFRRTSIENQLEDFLAYLDTAHRTGLPDIVGFLLREFEQVWARMADHAGPDALSVFLAGLEANDPGLMSDPKWRAQHGERLGLPDQDMDTLAQAPQEAKQLAASIADRAPPGLTLHSDLVLRHAAGRLFQEAHGYLEHVQPDLFGEADVSRVTSFTQNAAFFTPVPIARLLAEAGLRELGDLPNPLTVADFACGSAVFLAEVLHALQRIGFKGAVKLVGRDRSAAALVMARVAVAAAARGLTDIKVHPDLKNADAFEPRDWEAADLVLMNPPFRSWERMPLEERSWVRSVVPSQKGGRPDLSVGFLERALGAVRDDGVVATLVPAGILASEGLEKWRESLLARTTPKLVAVLGEHGLFRRAIVNVGMLVLKKSPTRQGDRLEVAWAPPTSGASSGTLRALRRTAEAPETLPLRERVRAGGTVQRLTIDAWTKRPNWLPGPGLLGSLLDTIEASAGHTVDDLFHVRQGIRTGKKDVFVISREERAALPAMERRHFAPAVESSSFVNGAIETDTYVFVVDDRWVTAKDVEAAVPMFFRTRLQPNQRELKERRGIKEGFWWQPTRERKWMFDGRPRLVSKRFGLAPAFARDYTARYAVLQANAWLPRVAITRRAADDLVRSILTAYWWLLNSNVMVALFREFCPNVAGGQLDLERKYVRHVPLPNLTQALEEGPVLGSLALEIRERVGDELPSSDDRNVFAAAAYGTEPADWQLGI